MTSFIHNATSETGSLNLPKKQRHTAKRIHERLREEYGFDGGYTIVKDYVRKHRRRTREMFVPLVHPPGHAQCDFGEACAGEPLRCQRWSGTTRVYPRVCGGADSQRSTSRSVMGLSPRVRGSPKPLKPAYLAVRSIPACAGEPLGCAQRDQRDDVYPRVCGGADSQRSTSRSIMGLSPRVRGSPSVAHSVTSVTRSIPACAGEPCQAPRQRCAGGVYPRVCGGATTTA